MTLSLVVATRLIQQYPSMKRDLKPCPVHNPGHMTFLPTTLLGFREWHRLVHSDFLEVEAEPKQTLEPAKYEDLWWCD